MNIKRGDKILLACSILSILTGFILLVIVFVGGSRGDFDQENLTWYSIIVAVPIASGVVMVQVFFMRTLADPSKPDTVEKEDPDP